MTRNDPADRKQRILRAAMDEFLDRGLHGARMQSIADRAGVNKALLHYYYGSKDELYRRVLEEISLPFWITLNEQFALLDPDDLEGAVRTVAEHVVRSTQELPHSAILLAEFAGGGRVVTTMDHLTTRASVEASPVLAFFAGLVQRGVIAPCIPLHVFVNVLGMSWNIFLAEPFTSPVLAQLGIERDEAYYRDYVELIVRMAVQGLIPRD